MDRLIKDIGECANNPNILETKSGVLKLDSILFRLKLFVSTLGSQQDDEDEKGDEIDFWSKLDPENNGTLVKSVFSKLKPVFDTIPYQEDEEDLIHVGKTKYKSKWFRNRNKNSGHVLTGYATSKLYSKTEVFELDYHFLADDISAMREYVKQNFDSEPDRCYSIILNNESIVCIACWFESIETKSK